MKKAFVIGMVLTSTLAGQMTFAAGAVAAKPMSLHEYVVKSKEFTFGKGVEVKNLQGPALEQAKTKVVNQLAVGGLKMELSKYISGSDALAKSRLENLVTFVATKRMIDTSISKENPAKAAELNRSVDALVKFTTNVDLKAEKPTGDILLLQQALNKIEEKGSEIITEFNAQDRKSFTEIIEETNRLALSETSLEEAFVKSIMNKKGVDRAKAMEIAKKLKECV